jgi:SulP family sulfate permease
MRSMPHSRLSPATPAASLASLPAAALRAALRRGYGREDLRADLLAGLVVGIVAVPLAMALAIATGVPPQHGLYTAIVAGVLAAALGGSAMSVTGPTAAFIVILAPIVQAHGIGGLLLAGIMAGALLVGLGLLRTGQLIQFIPHPVTTGFTSGIAVVIATLQLKDVFGLEPTSTPQHYIERVQSLLEAAGTAKWHEAAIAAITLATLLLWPRLTRRVPAPLVALPLAALLVLLATTFIDGLEFATIGNRFQTQVGDTIVRGIPQMPPLPVLPWSLPGPDGAPLHVDLDLLRALLPGAFAIAMLGAIESLLCAVVADGMARTRHDPDAELLGQGVANLVAPFFGGIPATGAIARTATNVRSGARSPVAAIVHGLVVLAAVVALAPLLAYLPMAALAALLLLVAWNMSEARHFVHIVRVAPRSDVAVLLTCFVLTVVFDMVIAVSVGIVLAALLFMRRMAEVTQARLLDAGAQELMGELPRGVVVYDISGPLFFGAAQKAMASLGAVHSRTRAVLLRMENVPVMDATGLVALESALESLRRPRLVVVFVGVQPQPLSVLRGAGIVDDGEGVRFAATIDEALALGGEHVRANPPPPTQRLEAVAPRP